MQYAILYTAHMIVGRRRLSHGNTDKLNVDHQKRLRVMATVARKKNVRYCVQGKAEGREETRCA